MVQQTNGQWSLPKGRCRPGESAKEACLRECREETGYKPNRIYFVSSGMNFRKTVRIYLWKSQVSPPFPGNNGIRGRSQEIRRIAWFNLPRARKVLKRWQWDLVAKALR